MDYYQYLKEELLAKRGAIDQLTQQSKIKGDYHEALIRDFAGRIVPSRCEVGHGIVYNERSQRSRECDVIIYSVSEKQPLFKSGDLVVVDSDQVSIVMQVKSVLDSSSLRDAVENLGSVRKVDHHIQLWVVGFDTRTLLRTLYFNAWQSGIINFLNVFSTSHLKKENLELLESQMRFFAENLAEMALIRSLANHLFIYAKMGKRSFSLRRPADEKKIRKLLEDIYENGFWNLYSDEQYRIPEGS